MTEEEEPKELKWLREYSNGRKELKENALKNGNLPDFASFDLEFWKKIYEEGKHAGATENGIQWHDLRKDPNDLPKGYQENTKFLCSDTEGKTLMLIRYGSFWQGNIDIIAWCENPQFKE